MDAVRGLPALHGGRRAGHPARRPAASLGAEIAGTREEWDAEIVDQEPDRRISWRSISGTINDGVVAFQPLGPSSTRVTLDLDLEPEGLKEKAGEKLGFVSRQVEGDLKRFKEFIESRGVETGAWRARV